MRIDRLSVEQRMVVALDDDERVARHVLRGNEPRQCGTVAGATDSEALSLAQRVVGEALVPSEVVAVGRLNRTGRARQILREKVGNGRSPMKQIPVESFLAQVGIPSRRAMARTSRFASPPSGKSTGASCSCVSRCRK